MMENINIKINKQTRQVNLSKSVIGNDGENLQDKLVFSFDNFVNGTARLELIKQGETASYIMLTKVGETYELPIKSVITKAGRLNMQLVITEGTNDEEIPVFKSNQFYVIVNSSINAEIEEEEEYPQWIDVANTKLNEIDEALDDLQDKLDSGYFKGEKGDTGEQGIQGIQGERGLQGEQGIQGIQGIQGERGQNGTNGQDAKINGVNTITITAGENITLNQSGSTLEISSTGGSGGTSDYTNLTNKPKINNVELSGNKTTSDLGLFSGDYNDLTNKPIIPQDTNYVINVDLHKSANNPLIITSLKPGAYALYSSNFSSTENIYVKAKAENTENILISLTDFSKENVLMVYSNVFEHGNLAFSYSSNNGLTYMIYRYRNNYNSGFSQTTDSYPLFKTSSGDSNTIASTNTYTGTNTFNTLPTSSIVPTTDNQMVNKKYVDDSINNAIGDINLVLATLTTPSGGE